jgi:hypothetical protein
MPVTELDNGCSDGVPDGHADLRTDGCAYRCVHTAYRGADGVPDGGANRRAYRSPHWRADSSADRCADSRTDGCADC